MDLQDTLEQIRAEIAPYIGGGAVADYIPSLASVDPHQFGMAVALNDGQVHVTGDGDASFSVQSISKVFSLALVIANDGDRIWRRVSREPSGNPFNSLLQLDQEHGKPRNPFINAGALVVTDRLHGLTGDASASMRALVRRESGNPDIDGDPQVAQSESEQGHRNAALAHLLASYDNLECPVNEVLEQYFWQCSLSMSCREVALAGRFLSRGGRPGRRHPVALAQPCQAHQRGHADLWYLRRRGRVRLSSRGAGKERSGRRHPGRHP